jgi:hypothetical protein
MSFILLEKSKMFILYIHKSKALEGRQCKDILRPVCFPTASCVNEYFLYVCSPNKISSVWLMFIWKSVERLVCKKDLAGTLPHPHKSYLERKWLKCLNQFDERLKRTSEVIWYVLFIALVEVSCVDLKSVVPKLAPFVWHSFGMTYCFEAQFRKLARTTPNWKTQKLDWASFRITLFSYLCSLTYRHQKSLFYNGWKVVRLLYVKRNLASS